MSMGFPRQEYWSGLTFPSPGDLPNPGIKPRSPALHIMLNAGLDEAQLESRFGRNINSLRYEDDSTLMAESEKEPKQALNEGEIRE